LGSAVRRISLLLDGLLDPVGGCPWDLKQTVRTVSEDFLEEVYELREALLEGDPKKIREEAGDLGFLLFFLGRLAAKDPELGFGLKDMLDAAVDKMVYRHPHVFRAALKDAVSPVAASAASVPADPASTPEAAAPPSPSGSGANASAAATSGGNDPAAVPSGANASAAAPSGESGPPPSNPEEVLVQWHALKRAERKSRGLLASVPAALPALARCHRLGAKASRAGFDWEGPGQVRVKLDEEIGELDRELGSDDRESPARAARIGEELGDCLAALANLARHLGLSAEKALQDHNRRFARRVGWMEERLAEEGRAMEACSAEELDGLWREAKERA
jgi:uncharacterized protein YabN with tetrapyrrole methylase and pyrophosphatase domain